MAGSFGAGGPERRPSQLSHGNQQRVQLVAALIHRPRLAVLDEPFTGIDPLGVETMSRILLDVAAAGTGVLFSSHQPDLVEDVCQDVVVIERGRVVLSGELESLRRSSPIRHIEVTVNDRPWSGAMFLDHEADGRHVVDAGSTSTQW
jgi:ABC-type uncharacterized transport system ATPase subunit